MAILTVGIDLAKNVFAVYCVNETGKADLVRPSVPRAKLHALVAALPPCVIGMQACSGAHHWARVFAAHGHTVKLMAPKLVAPYRMSGKRGKNDGADAAATCEAVQRPNMRFVPVKTCEQQSRLMVHRARQGFIAVRTANINRIRGLLSEFGIVLPLKAEVVRREAASHLEDLPGYANTVIGDLLSEVHHLDERIKQQYDRHVSGATASGAGPCPCSAAAQRTNEIAPPCPAASQASQGMRLAVSIKAVPCSRCEPPAACPKGPPQRPRHRPWAAWPR